jgi:hypothetical protein
MNHTPGPWIAVPPIERETSARIFAGSEYIGSIGNSDKDNGCDNASLIAAAPAYKLILDMIGAGVARLEKSQHCKLVELCFAGMRYCVTDGDYERILDCIGWDKAQAAISKAEGHK